MIIVGEKFQNATRVRVSNQLQQQKKIVYLRSSSCTLESHWSITGRGWRGEVGRDGEVTDTQKKN